MTRRTTIRLCISLIFLFALTLRATAQTASGNIYGTVNDESGAVLPGVSVTISGAMIGARATTSGGQGEFRFLNLDPGSYQLRVTLAGFATVFRTVSVNTGSNVNLSFALKPASVEESVTVTAETPVVDSKRIGTSTTLTKDELSQVPNSRDPWAILRTIPGVVVDRVNIGGNESGQQSNFTGKGADGKDCTFSMDGVVITDMAAIGSSPTYFDYDAFDEINVTTGGNDLKVATGGIGMNFVTKRGTNTFHGALRGYFTHRDLQATNIKGTGLETDARLRLPDGSFSDKADHIDQIADYGADLGGPIVKDKLWFWGSYGKQDIRNVRTNQTQDRTVLKDYTAKLNWQASPNDMFSAFYFLGAKEKYGRSPGVEGVEPDSFLWNQGGAYDGKLHGMLKGELNHIFSPDFFVNLKVAHYDTGFGFVPRGGADKDGGDDQFNGVGVGSFQTFQSLRPQTTGQVDASYFKTALGGNHELKFGFGYRKTPVNSSTSFSGSKVFAIKTTATGGFAQITRDAAAGYETQYLSGYVGDTFTKDRLTLNLGLRWDRQTGNNRPTTAAANPAFPNLLPALDYAGGGQGVKWNDLVPRVALSYALDQSRKTVARASYAHYAGQLAAGEVPFDNPVGANSILAYNWTDLNGDGLAQRNEILLEQGLQYFVAVDPANPGAAQSSPNKIDPNYKANHDDEIVVGLDRELFANFAVSAAYTYRKGTDITGWTPRLGATSADYVAGAPQSARGFTAVSYSPRDAVVDAALGGRMLMNRPDYSRTYNGLELSLMKRLSKKWMARAAFSYMNWAENLEGAGAIQNPARTDTSGGLFSGPQVNGGQIAPRSAGSGKGDIFYSPKWQVTANAMYQLPAGFEIAGSLFGRQGFPRPVILRLSGGGDGALRILATPEIDTNRYPNLWNVDFRLAKNITLAGTTSVQVTADLFNALNNNVELNRNRQANSSAFNRLDEVLSPRVLRFGLRLSF